MAVSNNGNARALQRSEQEQFLFETTVEASVKETVVALAEVHNLRAKIAVLKMEGEELAKHGPAKHPDKQGLDEYAEGPVEKGPHYTADPTGRRTGNGRSLSCCWGFRVQGKQLGAGCLQVLLHSLSVATDLQPALLR
jgi:hypothetical protein